MLIFSAGASTSNRGSPDRSISTLRRHLGEVNRSPSLLPPRRVLSRFATRLETQRTLVRRKKCGTTAPCYGVFRCRLRRILASFGEPILVKRPSVSLRLSATRDRSRSLQRRRRRYGFLQGGRGLLVAPEGALEGKSLSRALARRHLERYLRADGPRGCSRCLSG